MAHKAHGAILKHGATAVEGELISISTPTFEMEFVDTTHHGSGPWRTQLPTLVAPGEATFRIRLTTGAYAALLALIDPDAAATAWTVSLPFATPEVVSFSGWLATLPIEDVTIDGLLEAAGKIVVTGETTAA